MCICRWVCSVQRVLRCIRLGTCLRKLLIFWTLRNRQEKMKGYLILRICGSIKYLVSWVMCINGLVIWTRLTLSLSSKSQVRRERGSREETRMISLLVTRNLLMEPVKYIQLLSITRRSIIILMCKLFISTKQTRELSKKRSNSISRHISSLCQRWCLPYERIRSSVWMSP